MGYPLYREVKNYAPADLKPAELLLLLLIADDANDKTRLSFASREQLVKWMRMSEWDGVKKVLQRLRDHKLELRVPFGEDRAGRPVYARSGHKSVYKIPNFESKEGDQPAVEDGHAPEPDDVRGDGHPPSQGGQSSPLDGVRGDNHPGQGGSSSRPGGIVIPPISSISSRSPHLSPIDPAERALRGSGIEDEREIKSIIGWATDTHRPRGGGWWNQLHKNGDIPALVADWRAQQTAAAPTAPPWCGACGGGNPAARTNPRFRTDSGIPCPSCHPTVDHTMERNAS
ncbi:hypothetical protein [Frankia tisae]|uniref:hypothetical protein n=1 Tax=Frankia tisae TaxID=2950104 RepID=UPI0021BF4066|nr:hypothetical protein [Frankia tisae]